MRFLCLSADLARTSLKKKGGGKRERGFGQHKGRWEDHTSLEMVKKFQARFSLNPW